jgi:hypothetical protein
MTPLHLAGALILLAVAVILIIEDEHFMVGVGARPARTPFDGCGGSCIRTVIFFLSVVLGLIALAWGVG